jgi:hypothetical protein
MGTPPFFYSSLNKIKLKNILIFFVKRETIYLIILKKIEKLL